MIVGWILFILVLSFVLGGALSTITWEKRAREWGICDKCGRPLETQKGKTCPVEE